MTSGDMAIVTDYDYRRCKLQTGTKLLVKVDIVGWRFDVAVASLVASTKLLYIESG